jgi:dienelactone hydrolase
VPTLTLRGRRCGHRIASVGLALALTGGVIAAAPGAGAQSNPFQRGPNPTTASIEATTGAFATSTTTVARGNGFGGGTIYFPTDTSQGTFGAIVVTPGFTATQSSISWLGPRIASQGFVLMTIDTNSRFDNPTTRATEMQSALNFLVNSSSVRTRIDASRLALMGHSMGGGGTLEATQKNTALQAAIPLMPWDQNNKNFSGIRTPTMIIGSQNDTVAPVNQHSIPFFNSIPAASEKAYLELAGASHTAANSPNTTLAKFAISWLKRFVDNDTRYEQFLCPPPAATGAISQYQNTCPSS